MTDMGWNEKEFGVYINEAICIPTEQEKAKKTAQGQVSILGSGRTVKESDYFRMVRGETIVFNLEAV